MRRKATESECAVYRAYENGGLRDGAARRELLVEHTQRHPNPAPLERRLRAGRAGGSRGGGGGGGGGGDGSGWIDVLLDGGGEAVVPEERRRRRRRRRRRVVLLVERARALAQAEARVGGG